MLVFVHLRSNYVRKCPSMIRDNVNIIAKFAPVLMAGFIMVGCNQTTDNNLGIAANEVSASVEAPEGVVYCGGGQVKRQIEYALLPNSNDKWDAMVTVNGKTTKAMTSYSYFGNAKAPKGFVVALLGEDRSEFLVFRDGQKDWLEFGDYTYRKCN